MNSGIYEILNTANGKRYVGSAMNLRLRFNEHRTRLNTRKHHSRHLQSSWDKHGASTFVFRPILICAPKDLLFYEQRAIDGLNPEFNICRVAGSTLGRNHSAETRAKIAAKAVGRKWSPESIAKLSATTKGRKKPPELCAKMVGNKYAAGVIYSAERRAQISAFMTGQKRPKDAAYRAKIAAALKGRPRTAEQSVAQSAGQLGRKRGPYKSMSAETRAHIAELRKARPNPAIGRPRPPEVIEKMRKALTGRPLSQVHAASISSASTRMWADPEKRKVILDAQRLAKERRNAKRSDE